MKVLIASRKDELLEYTLCRQWEGCAEFVVEHRMEYITRDGYRMQTLIAGIVGSAPFLNHQIQEPSISPTAPE